MGPTSASILLAGRLRAAPDEVEALAAALRALVPATLLEDGCLAYAFAVEDAAAGTILVHEHWRDQAALDAHLAQPAVVAVLGTWADRIAVDEVTKFDASNPRGLLDP